MPWRRWLAQSLGGPATPRRADEHSRPSVAVPRLQLMPVDAVLARSAAEAAADHLLRGADALYAAMAHLLGLPLITLDAELRRRAAGLVRVVAP
jgi:predicted nucleic acid-binding protein